MNAPLEDHIQFHMLLTELCIDLSIGQRCSLSQILQLCQNINQTSEKTVSHIKNIPCHLPYDKNDIRNKIMEGKHAIMTNLPHPSIRLVERHAYTLPSQCAIDAINHGVICNNENSKSINQLSTSLYKCKQAVSLVRYYQQMEIKTKVQTDFLLATEWSDDFKPSYSIKGNRGFVWIRTMTFVHPFKNNNIRHTYPLCIGHKNSSHCVPSEIIDIDLMSLLIGPQRMYRQSASNKLQSFDIIDCKLRWQGVRVSFH